MNLKSLIQSVRAADAAIKTAKSERKKLFADIGKQIRNRRKEIRMKQKTFAKSINVSQPGAFFIEHGESALDSQLLKKIAGVLGW